MMIAATRFLFCVHFVCGSLWKNGIVHYSISSKDYDAHSQDIIVTTLSKLQKEICLKFFQAQNFNSTDDKILYINNVEKKKTCSPAVYNYTKHVIDMPIGYKCINEKDIARIVVDMLKASVNPVGIAINSYDLIKKFEETDANMDTLISTKDRNYINIHYQSQCLESQPYIIQRRLDNSSTDALQLSARNMEYYDNKLWPLAIVLYGVDRELKNTEDYNTLKEAMSLIESSTCVVFQEYEPDDVLVAKNYLWFGDQGSDMPYFGFYEGTQKLKLSSFIRGSPGHTAHLINNLLRVLGIHMMSNRFDRDNYVVINWGNVEKGKEQFLEKAPESAWLVNFPYDFSSVTHAPANFMCAHCELGQTTVHPVQVQTRSSYANAGVTTRDCWNYVKRKMTCLQEHLWQRTMSMGHSPSLSPFDVQLISILYTKQCRNRYTSH